jgi:hypothetical protein
MIFDVVSPVMQALAYILLLAALVTYYIKAFHQPQLRRFWLLFALAMTLTFIANIVWIVRFVVTQSPLDAISVIDLFYISSYILIGFALWSHPQVLRARVWLWVAAAMFITALLIFAVYLGYVADSDKRNFSNFIIFAAYPIFDAGLITLAWIRYKMESGTRWAGIALLLACAVTSYGLGNSIEVIGFVFAPVMGGFLQNLFWILRHVFVLLVAISVRKPSDVLND